MGLALVEVRIQEVHTLVQVAVHTLAALDLAEVHHQGATVEVHTLVALAEVHHQVVDNNIAI